MPQDEMLERWLHAKSKVSAKDDTRNVLKGNLVQVPKTASAWPYFRRRPPMPWLHTLWPRHAMSSTTESSPNRSQDSPKNNADDDDVLAGKLEKLQLQSADSSLDAPSEFVSANGSLGENSTPRPFIVYTRKELIHLSTSPLVKVPDGMPAFKVWFGCVRFQGFSFSSASRSYSELEQVPPQGKKESEQTNGNGTDRNRRYSLLELMPSLV